MSSATKKRGRIQRTGAYVCPGQTHEYPRPLLGRRPVVVFCSRCQTAKDIK